MKSETVRWWIGFLIDSDIIATFFFVWRALLRGFFLFAARRSCYTNSKQRLCDWKDFRLARRRGASMASGLQAYLANWGPPWMIALLIAQLQFSPWVRSTLSAHSSLWPNWNGIQRSIWLRLHGDKRLTVSIKKALTSFACQVIFSRLQ